MKFKHVFTGLMTLSALAAFVIPSRFVSARKPNVEILFAPVSRPSGAAARWAHDKLAHDLSSDQRTSEVVKRENEALRDHVSNLQVQLADLKRIAQDRERIGDIRPLCTPYAVIGTDSGSRATLAIQGSSMQGLSDGMVALYPSGIVGRVQKAGVGGTRVQLVTDLGFRVLAGFARFNSVNTFLRISHSRTVIEGTGRGAMVIRGLTREDVKSTGLVVGDWAILDEPDWAPYLQGRAIGRIISIGSRPDAPLYAQIVVEPWQNLLRLKEVMIVTGNAETADQSGQRP